MSTSIVFVIIIIIIKYEYIGQETFSPVTYCTRTYIVPGQYVALFDIILLETFGNFWQ